MTKNSEATREKQRIYAREWRRRNPERCREIQHRYWERRLLREAENAAPVKGGDA